MTSAWRDCKLGDVITLKRGYDLPEQDRRPGPFPIVSSSGVTGHHAEAKVNGPGVVTGRYGTLGQVFYVEDAFWPLNTSLYVQDFKGNDPRFVSYFIRSLNLGTRNVAGAVPGVNRNHLHALAVRLPPLPLQRRIAGIVSVYDDLIENNLQRIRILEEMSRALYREWFVECRFPGFEDVHRVNSRLGAIPEGWGVRKLSELVKTQYGYTESASQVAVGPKYLRGMDINKGSYIDWSQVPYCPISTDKRAVYQLRKGDIVVIRMADPGKVGIVEEDVDAVFASYLIRVTPTDEALLPYFLFHILDSPAYRGYISGAATGATRKSASAGVITDFSFALPPRGLVEVFEERVRSLRALLTTLLKQSASLRCTRDLLVPRLLSGQIALKDAAA